MTLLLESPWPAIVFGVLAEAGLAIALLKTGQIRVVWMMLATALLCAGLVLLEFLVVTDREQIETTLDTIAERLVSDNPLSVVEFVSPSAAQLRSSARQALSEVAIEEARVLSDLEITVNRLKSPPTATARFSGRFRGRAKHAAFGHEFALLRFVVQFEYDQERWLVAKCEWSQARAPGAQ